MFSHLAPKERFGYFTLGMLFLFGAGYVGATKFKPRPPLVVQEVVEPNAPKPAEPAVTKTPQTTKKHPSAAVNLNQASSEQLQTIPGIGPATAERILDYRKQHGRFRSVDELRAISGFGPKKLQKMRAWLRV
ncbi:MAG TPA: ComEA family DNA-binding protein [Fimbriimonas sp.]|nr:ComEA family DNA-binding protein [Fimbriimonas sp.]